MKNMILWFDDTKHPTTRWIVLGITILLLVSDLYLYYFNKNEDCLAYIFPLLIMPLCLFFIAFFDKQDNVVSKDNNKKTVQKNHYCSFAFLSIFLYALPLFFVLIIDEKANNSYLQQITFVCYFFIFFVVSIITIIIKELLSKETTYDNTFYMLFYILSVIVSTNNIFLVGFMSNDLYLRNNNNGEIGVYINPISSHKNFINKKNYLQKTHDVKASLKFEKNELRQEIFTLFEEVRKLDGNVGSLPNEIDIIFNNLYSKDNKERFSNKEINHSESSRKSIHSIFTQLINCKYNWKDEHSNNLLADTIAFSIDKNYENRISQVDTVINELKSIYPNYSYENLEYKKVLNDILKLYLHDIGNGMFVKFKQGTTITNEAKNELSLKREENIIKASDLIKKLSKHAKLTIILIGHTNALIQRDKNYFSNYELAEGRANEVKQQLIEKINDSSGVLSATTWHIIPQLNHDEIIKNNTEKTKNYNIDNTEENNELSVDIHIEAELNDTPLEITNSELDKPTFLEYMYFTYSLLGTGYGDMFPVSPEAKFLCSVANFLELYFLVIFLNIFFIEVSKGSKKNEEDKPVQIVSSQTKH